MNLPKKSIVDPLDTHIRIGDEEDAIAIGSTEGEITQVRGQAIQNGEADVVETFRRHVESERKQLTSLVKQAQIEEYVHICEVPSFNNLKIHVKFIWLI